MDIRKSRCFLSNETQGIINDEGIKEKEMYEIGEEKYD